MKAAELKNKSADELKGMMADLKKEQFNLRMQAAAGEAVSGNRIREVRRTIARVLTLVNMKKKG
jgi:large subunit ribosomal protein L29